MRRNANMLWAAIGGCVLLVLGSCPAVHAQTQRAPQPTPNITTPHQVAVTGCLRRAGMPGTYAITDETGTTWVLTSNSADIDLSRQVMHVVAVTGKEAPGGSSPNDGQPGNPPRSLRVLTLKTLSPSCTR